MTEPKKRSWWVYLGFFVVFVFAVIYGCYVERWEVPPGKFGVLSLDPFFGSWTVERVYPSGPASCPHYTKFSRPRKMEFVDDKVHLPFHLQGKGPSHRTLTEKAKNLFSGSPEDRYVSLKGEVVVELNVESVIRIMGKGRDDYLVLMEKEAREALPELLKDVDISNAKVEVEKKLNEKFQLTTKVEIMEATRQSEKLKEDLKVKCSTIDVLDGFRVGIFRWERLPVVIPLVIVVLVVSWFIAFHCPILRELVIGIGSWL